MTFKEFVSTYQKEPITEFPNSVTKEPVISICVQTYQHKNFISECLDGILAQKTDCDYEILLGEDESTDGTREICIEYARKYPDKIRLFLHKRENQIKVLGQPTGNFNTLYNLFSSKGKYIAICEGDDYWTDPNKIQKQFDFMEGSLTYSICYHNFKIIDNYGHVINSDKAYPLTSDISGKNLILQDKRPSTLTIFFRNVINDIPKEMVKVISQDVLLYSLLGSYGPGKYISYIKPARYRVHNGGIWSNKAKKQKNKHKIYTYLQISFYWYRTGNYGLGHFFLKKTAKYILHRYIKKS